MLPKAAAAPSPTVSQSSAEALRLFAPAKVNLYLHVTGQRPDGYHLLDSLFVFASALGDALTLAPSPEFQFALDGPQASNLAGEDWRSNLVARAALGYWRALGRSGEPPVALTLTKALPVAAGLGGGSSDAAACLKAMARMFGPLARPEALQDLALGLGADLPACLCAQAQWVSGIGEVCQPLGAAWPGLEAVLVQPGRALSTPAVFKTRAMLSRGFRSAVEQPGQHVTPNDWINWLADQGNDLEAAALSLEPAIAEVLAALRAQAGCRLARLSGSGASCFALFDSAAESQAAARALSAAHPHWWVGASRLL